MSTEDGDMQSLLSLVQLENGNDWPENRKGWDANANEPLCSWTGIKCDPIDKSIIKIDLEGIGLGGTIPSELGNLSGLIHVNLNKNSFRGSIPKEVSSLPNLEVFNARNNSLTGHLPIFSSKRVTEVDFGHNLLTGTISHDFFSNLPNAIKMDLSRNSLAGSIPTSIVTMSNLKFLDIGYNKISGSIQSEIGMLEELQGLFLNDNTLVGTFPLSLTRETLKLVQIFLEHNSLSGTIPATVANLPFLVDLFIDGNKFTGTVPPDLCNLYLNTKFFEDVKDAQLRNGCTSISCPVNFVSREGVYPCFECRGKGFNPYLGRNGNCYHSDEKEILDILYDSTDGPRWNGGAGWGLDNVPACGYEGVECDSAGHVTSIRLAGRGLTGSLPGEIGFLRHLQVLDISDNNLTGHLPSDIRFPPIEEFNIAGNKIEGIVPPMLCLTGDINGNGFNGAFKCDIITCAQGTWSPIGRATPVGTYEKGTKNHFQCKPCFHSTNKYLGSKQCDWKIENLAGAFNNKFTRTNSIITGLFVLCSFFCVAFLFVVRRRKLMKHQEEKSNDDLSQSDTGYFSDEQEEYISHVSDIYDDENLSTWRSSGDDVLMEGFQLPMRQILGETTMKGNEGTIKEDNISCTSDNPQSILRTEEESVERVTTYNRANREHPSSSSVASRYVTEDASEVDWDSIEENSHELWLDVPKIT